MDALKGGEGGENGYTHQATHRDISTSAVAVLTLTFYLLRVFCTVA